MGFGLDVQANARSEQTANYGRQWRERLAQTTFFCGIGENSVLYHPLVVIHEKYFPQLTMAVNILLSNLRSHCSRILTKPGKILIRCTSVRLKVNITHTHTYKHTTLLLGQGNPLVHHISKIKFHTFQCQYIYLQ